MGELLTGVEALFRAKGPGTPGTKEWSAASTKNEALDGDLDAFLDRALFADAEAEQAHRKSGSPASKDLRALLDLADDEKSWLETRPGESSAESVTHAATEALVPEWLRAKSEVKAPSLAVAPRPLVAPEQERWPHGLLPDIPMPSPMEARQVPPMTPSWGTAAVGAGNLHQQPWGIPGAAPVERRILGMTVGTFFSAIAVGALSSALLMMTGLRYVERQESDARGGSAVSAFPGALTVSGTVRADELARGNGAALAGTNNAQGLVLAPGVMGGGTALLGGAGGSATAPGVAAGVTGGGITTQGSISGITTAPGVGSNAATAQGSAGGTTAPGVPGTSTVDLQRAVDGLRADSLPSATGGRTAALTTGLETEALPAAKASSKSGVSVATTVAAQTAKKVTPRSTGERVTEMSFGDTEESSTPATSEAEQAAEAEEAEAPRSELDEEFARELGFTEEADAAREAEAAEEAPQRTVYVPPAVDGRESLTPEDVKQVVLSNQPAITECLREHTQGVSSQGGGRFTMKWSVQPDGTTSSVSMDTDALKGTPLAHCVEDVVRRWKFPVHHVKLQEPIRFPFVY